MIKKLPPGIASVCDETELNNWASHPRNTSTLKIVFIENTASTSDFL